MTNLTTLSVIALAQTIRDKAVSVEEVIQAHLERIAVVNPKLNAVVQLTAETALTEAREADAALAKGEPKGLLHGVPMTLKDSIDTAGVITTGGTQGRQHYLPKRDATVVARLRQAGAILLGKTNTPELTLSFETNNLIYGRTNNPYAITHSPGGSSGGAAAIVAAGGVPFDLSSDTGGSIRQPAHFCGLAGLKPTSGRVPRTGHIVSYDMGAFDSWTQIGPLARSVEDLRLILSLIAGVDTHDPAIVPMPLGHETVSLDQLRLAYYTDNDLVRPSPEIISALQSARQALVDAGVTVEDNRPDEVCTTETLWLDLMTADGAAWVQRALDEAGTTDVWPPLRERFMAHEPISTAEFTAKLSELDRVRSAMLNFMADYDAILCPVNAFPAMPHEEAVEKSIGYSYTRIYNLTGWPVVVVRGGTSPEGLPIGLQIVARPWREDVAFAIGTYLESVLGGWQPPNI